MHALIDISNQMLEDSAFDHAGASLRKAGLAVAINEMPKRRSVAEWLRRGPVAGCEMRLAEEEQAAGAEQASAWRGPRREGRGGVVPSFGHRRSGPSPRRLEASSRLWPNPSSEWTAFGCRSTRTLGMAWADEWRFTDVVTPSRKAQLRSWGSFNEIVAAILQSAAERFWWEPFRSPRLIGCNRASVTLRVTPRVYDGLFNSPQGYRAQYAMSPSVGEAANRALMDSLEPLLMSAAQFQGNVAAELVRHSLRAVDAKVWIVEAEVEDQLSDPAPALAYAPWEFNSPEGQGLRAPVGTSIEAKGGWLDAHGAEKRDPLKAGRSLQIHKTGFS